MNQIIISALNPKFKKLEKPLKKVVPILFQAFPGLKNRHLEVYLVGRETMNKNVLAFPAPQNFVRPDLKGKKPLGEIYLNPDYIKKEKLSPKWLSGRGASFRSGGIVSQKLAYMLIHGFLHLLGYDHKTSRDTIRMRKKEKQLLKKLE